MRPGMRIELPNESLKHIKELNNCATEAAVQLGIAQHNYETCKAAWVEAFRTAVPGLSEWEFVIDDGAVILMYRR